MALKLRKSKKGMCLKINGKRIKSPLTPKKQRKRLKRIKGKRANLLNKEGQWLKKNSLLQKLIINTQAKTNSLLNLTEFKKR